MAFEERKVIKEGYEKVVEILETAIEEIETAKQEEIDRLIAEVESKYAERLNDYKIDLARYVHVETIEIPDEVETPVEETVEETNLEEVALEQPVNLGE